MRRSRNRDFTYAPISLRPSFEMSMELDRAARRWRVNRSQAARMALTIGLQQLSVLPSPADVEAEQFRRELEAGK